MRASEEMNADIWRLAKRSPLQRSFNHSKVLAGDAEFIEETQTWRRLVPLPKLGELLEATKSVDAPTFVELVML